LQAVGKLLAVNLSSVADSVSRIRFMLAVNLSSGDFPAPPEAFGFLGERQPTGIAVQGSLLQVPDGETQPLVAPGVGHVFPMAALTSLVS
jgi:hypothetical protein